MVDRYTKVVLTVPALMLVWLCVQGQKQAAIQDVNVVAVAGAPIGGRPTRAGALPVRIEGSVEVEGSVDCY